MKKFISFLCALTIVLSASAVPAKPTNLQSKKAQTMQIAPSAEKVMLGKTFSPNADKKGLTEFKVIDRPQAKAVKSVTPRTSQKAVRRPKVNLSIPQRARKADSTEVREFNVADAIAAVDAGEVKDDDEIAVHGIITKMEFKGTNFKKYGSVNIYVADAEGNEGEFEFYNCYSLQADTFRTSDPEYDPSSTKWASFESVTDGNGVTVKVGDEVVAQGKFKKYNSTYELNTGCYLIYLRIDDEDPYEGDADEDFYQEYTGIGYYDSGLSYDNVYYHIVQAFDENTFCGLYFLTEGAFVTPGEYPIEGSWETGTVLASASINNYSLISTLTANESITAPYWCMVSGVVTVTEDEIIVNALNSKGHKIYATIPNQLPKQEEGVPTVADLKDLGYDLENDLVVAMRFLEGAPVCNDIVFVGNYNDWDVSEPDQLPRFEKLQGFDGWYVCSLPYWQHDAVAQGKPVQLLSDGKFNWEYQAGDADAWIHRGGNQAWLESWYVGEVNVYYEQPGAYIYDIAYWKNHNTPCDVQEERVIVAVNVPEGAPEAGVEVIGSFDNWTGVSMELLETGWYVAFDIKATAKDEFKFREAGTWENEILYYDEDYDMWRGLPNLKFGDYWTDDTYKGEPVKWIELDFSDPERYRWSTQPADTIRLNFAEPMQIDYYASDGDWYLQAGGVEYGYKVYLDIVNNNPESPAGIYTTADLFEDYTRVFQFVTDTTGYNYYAQDAKIEIVEKDNRINVSATLFCADGNVYEVTMFYEAATPTREMDLISDNAQLNAYESAWQITGYNVTGDGYISLAAYTNVVSGEYTGAQLAGGYCWAAVYDTIVGWNYYDMSDALLNVTYNEDTNVAHVTGWMIAINENNSEDVVQFNLDITTASGKQYDAEDEDFAVQFAEYEVYVDNDGVVYVDAINEALQYIELEILLPEGETDLVPGVYPVSGEGIRPSVVEGDYVNGISGSFAANLIYNEESGGYSVQAPLWWLTEGKATVAEDGSITVEALNSYERSIKCYMAKRYVPQVVINTCEEAAEAAMSVSQNNELFNNGQIFTIPGYVTEISTVWSAQYKNVSFWLADTKDGGRVIQAFRAVCESEADAPKVGDYVEVTGALTKYNNTPEFAAGCTFEIISRDLDRCGDNLTWTLVDGVLTIEGTGAMWDYETVGPWGDAVTEVNLPEGLTYIGTCAFEGCSLLTSITIPSTVEEIGHYAFYNAGLQSLYIPATIQVIGQEAFAYNYYLTDVRAEYNPNLGWYGNGLFAGCNNIMNIEVPLWYLHQIKSENLINAVFTASGRTIASEYVENLHLAHKTLQFVDFSATSLTVFPDEILRNCYNLTCVVLPQNIDRIGFGALAECKLLQSILIPASVVEIGPSAFEDCRSLTLVEFEQGSRLESIGNWAFYNCHNLPAITIPEGVMYIGDGAFYGCVYAESLQLPASVIAIGDNAFALCSKLAEIHVDALLPPEIMAKTFFEVSREAPVFVPDGCYDIYKNHIYWGELNIIKNTQGMDQVGSNAKVRKIVRDGQVLIIRGERTFTTTGAEIK